MEKQRSSKRAIIALLALCILAAGFIAAWQMFGAKGSAGEKIIRVQILVDGRQPATHTIETDAEFLRQALEEPDLIAGEESAYGLFVKTVDGVTADDSKQEWWCFTKGGADLMTGVDDTPILDGDQFEITLMVGYGSNE